MQNELKKRAALFFMALPGFGRVSSRRIFQQWQSEGCPEYQNDMRNFLVGAIHELPEKIINGEKLRFDDELDKRRFLNRPYGGANDSELNILMHKWDKSAGWAGGLERRGISLILEPDYLWCRDIPVQDRPFALFIRGNKSLLEKKGAAVIGCRYPTPDGYEAAFREGRRIAERGQTVISGLALGCDTAGHRGALDAGGKTLAYMPCGLGRMYPPENRGLAYDILEKDGALVSEYLPQMSPAAWRFIDRDRLQAAQSVRLFIAECGLEGGTWHTIRFARKYGARLDISRHFNVLNPEESQKGNVNLCKNPEFMPSIAGK